MCTGTSPMRTSTFAVGTSPKAFLGFLDRFVSFLDYFYFAKGFEHITKPASDKRASRS